MFFLNFLSLPDFQVCMCVCVFRFPASTLFHLPSLQAANFVRCSLPTHAAFGLPLLFLPAGAQFRTRFAVLPFFVRDRSILIVNFLLHLQCFSSLRYSLKLSFLIVFSLTIPADLCQKSVATAEGVCFPTVYSVATFHRHKLKFF